VTFFHNKLVIIAVFASAGTFALIIAFILVTVLVHQKRPRDLIDRFLPYHGPPHPYG
jgi:energy-coupling factor transporter transmembrane protein EcfT